MAERSSNCACCHWWSRIGGSNGSCRIRAPVVVANPDADTHREAPYLSVFPMTAGSDWCGEWLKAEPVE